MAHEVVIIGGGFGGLYGAKRFRPPAHVTLLDRRNFHLFQPLLYQVATGALSPGNIAVPLRALLRRRRSVQVLLGEAVDLDVAGRRVILDTGDWLEYDSLIIATGSTHTYFGNEQWEPLAPGLKTIEDAIHMRRRILYAFEAAEREEDPQAVSEWLTFVIVGGGPTGVELAGAIAEIAHDTLRHDFRTINPENARIIVVEGKDRVLGTYPDNLSHKAQQSLKRLKVELILDSRVVDISDCEVRVKNDATGAEQTLRTRTVLWGAGVQATPFGRTVAERTGAPTDRAGRIMVERDLSVPGHPEIFVIGDLANYPYQTGQPLPGVAQVAMQQGAYLARLIDARLRGRRLPEFRYRDFGNMATIGRASAVADLGRIDLWGWVGWLAWLFIHLMYIVQFQNKILVLVQWAWNYVTRNRSARLITGEDLASDAHR